MNMSGKIKICHLTSAHADGDIRIFHKECVSLAEAGNDVHLVIPNTTSRKEKNVNIHSFNFKTTNRLQRMLKTTKKVYKTALEIDADIYHFHDPELLPYGLKLKRKGKIVIYDAHEDLPKQILGKPWIAKPLRKIIATIFRRYENFIAKRLDYIITATPFIRDRFAKINKNSIDINNFPLLSELTELTNWDQKDKSVCYIGGITQIRGLEQLVEAMDFVPDVTLHLAGSYSPDSFQDDLKSRKGWSKVIEHGFVSRIEANQIMSHSQIGIVTFLPLPNHVDAQPNKMFEYMSSGIPVIGSFFPLWKEILEKNRCGICVNPESPQEIAEAIKYLINNPEKSRKMGENGRKIVLEKYNWSIEKQKLISIYHSLMPKE